MEFDLLIQDFVTTNKLVNQTIGWDTLVSRRFENGRIRHFTFGSKVARGEHVDMADGEWFVIDLTRPEGPFDIETLRFDCLRLMYATTHYDMKVEEVDSKILVKLFTRNRGLMNVLFRFT